MNRQRYSKGDILIDLTSLLDVVFIVLAIVLCNQQYQIKTLETAGEQLMQERDSIEQKQNEMNEREKQVAEREEVTDSQYVLYKDQLNTGDNLMQYVLTISVNVGYVTPDMKERNINILAGGEENPEVFHLKGENTEELNTFEEKLKKYIEDNDDKPVILSLNEDEEKILWRDEYKIKEIFEKLGNNYDNVYEKN